jgi:hypothetical protein
MEHSPQGNEMKRPDLNLERWLEYSAQPVQEEKSLPILHSLHPGGKHAEG